MARVGEDEWRLGGRRARERMVERAIMPVWVIAAIMQRTAWMLAQSEEPASSRMDDTQVALLTGLVSRLTAVWAITAVQVHLNFWTTSHRLHDRERVVLFGLQRAGLSCALLVLHAASFHRRHVRRRVGSTAWRLFAALGPLLSARMSLARSGVVSLLARLTTS